MGRPIFTVRGRIASADGAPVPNAYVAIVDADPDLDDLLGAGATAPDGSFRLSFTAEAFNQEPLENELVPDLYIVVSLSGSFGGTGPATLSPFFRRDFDKLTFSAPTYEEDLGTISIPAPSLSSPLGTGAPLRSAPGRGKIVKRLHLDDELVGIAAAEIAPLVERLTGWSNLLDGIEIRIVDSYREDRRARLRRALARPNLTPRQLALIEASASECAASTVASWQPDERAILLNRTMIEENAFDFLKVTIGHELVHVGQSRMIPTLGETLRRTHREEWAKLLEGKRLPRAEWRQAVQLLANVEGYAHYIETRWLLPIYTHGVQLMGPTHAADATFRERASPRIQLPEKEKASTISDHLDDLFKFPGVSYVVGENFYRIRALTTGATGPQPFDPALGSWNDATLEEAALAVLLYREEHPKQP